MWKALQCFNFQKIFSTSLSKLRTVRKALFFLPQECICGLGLSTESGILSHFELISPSSLKLKAGSRNVFLRSKSCRELGAEDRRAQNNDEEVMYRGKAQVSKLHLLSIMGRAIWSHLWHHIVYHNIELMFNDLIYKIGLRHYHNCTLKKLRSGSL